MERFRGREEADAVVVGAGPTGLMVAGELALAGVAVEVIERQAVPSGQSRGGGVNPRTLGGADGDCWMLMHPLEKTGERTGLHRVMFAGPEQQTLSPQAPVTADEVARALTAVHGQETELRRLRWGTRFSDATRQVIGGQGLNLGVRPGCGLLLELSGLPSLIRPDGHVCWAGAGPSSSPEPAPRRWFGATPVRAA